MAAGQEEGGMRNEDRRKNEGGTRQAMKWLSRELSLISLWPQWIYCLHSQPSCAKSLSRQSVEQGEGPFPVSVLIPKWISKLGDGTRMASLRLSN